VERLGPDRCGLPNANPDFFRDHCEKK
jgi:hypothetical protein